MTNQVDEETLLYQFRQWLQEAHAEAEELERAPHLPEADDHEFGLYRLVEEFTALRHELKLETRSARGLQAQAETLFQSLQSAVEQIRVVASREAQAAWSAGKPLAEALADLDEALQRGRAELDKAGPRLIDEPARALQAALVNLHASQSWFRRRRFRSYHEQVLQVVLENGTEARRDLFNALLEGYSLIQGRLHRAMSAEEVVRIDCVGQRVDPESMTVIEVVEAPNLPSGQVIEELRRGYTWKGRVFRFAEVRASRMTAPTRVDERVLNRD